MDKARMKSLAIKAVKILSIVLVFAFTLQVFIHFTTKIETPVEREKARQEARAEKEAKEKEEQKKEEKQEVTKTERQTDYTKSDNWSSRPDTEWNRKQRKRAEVAAEDYIKYANALQYLAPGTHAYETIEKKMNAAFDEMMNELYLMD